MSLSNLHQKRKAGGVKYVTLHHSANPKGSKTRRGLLSSIKSYDRLHSSRSWALKSSGAKGYRWIAYHGMFARNGDYEQTQAYWEVRYHASDWGRGLKSSNQWGVGLCVDGYFESPHNHSVSDRLLRSIAKVIYKLDKKYKKRLVIDLHKNVSLTGTACPGSGLMNALPKIKKYRDQLHKNNGKYPTLPSKPKPQTTKTVKAKNTQVKVLKQQLATARARKQQADGQIKDLSEQLSLQQEYVKRQSDRYEALKDKYNSVQNALASAESELEKWSSGPCAIFRKLMDRFLDSIRETPE